jgi:hypothetical protein
LNTAEQLISAVVRKVQDASFSREDILGFLNQGLIEVAGLVKLPDLSTSDTVTTATDSPFIPLPSNYHRGLYAAVSTDQNRRVKIEESFLKFLTRYPMLNVSGSVSLVSVGMGNCLYYQGIPASPDDLILYFYKKPVPLVSDGDIPTCLPEHLQAPILVNFAAKEIFNLIEEGLDGKTPNTDRHGKLYGWAVSALAAFVPPAPAEPEYVEEHNDYTDEF